MRQFWDNLRTSRKAAIMLLPVCIAILLIFLTATKERGCWYKEEFFSLTAENVWQGVHCGEPLTVTRTRTDTGGTLVLSSPSGIRTLEAEGEIGFDQTVALYENGHVGCCPPRNDN